jgi:hypothetical protein
MNNKSNRFSICHYLLLCLLFSGLFIGEFNQIHQSDACHVLSNDTAGNFYTYSGSHTEYDCLQYKTVSCSISYYNTTRNTTSLNKLFRHFNFNQFWYVCDNPHKNRSVNQNSTCTFNKCSVVLLI